MSFIGLSSNNAGILIVKADDPRKNDAVIDLYERKIQPNLHPEACFRSTNDWLLVRGDHLDEIICRAETEYWNFRATSLFREIIVGFPEEIEQEIAEHLESLFPHKASAETVLDRLLIAPLKPEIGLDELKARTLGYGLSTTASILDDLSELQAPLRRLVDVWLSLDAQLVGQFSVTSQQLWATVVDKLGIQRLLKARGSAEFSTFVNSLLFEFQGATERKAIYEIWKRVTNQLFPTVRADDLDLIDEMDDPDEEAQAEPQSGGYQVYTRVNRQIQAIIQAVSEGRDSKARMFLHELRDMQARFPGGESYAVKSLCNIAKRCSELFRHDFEAECLSEALQILPSDPWTLVQYGDYLKRKGEFDEAITVLKKALQFGDVIVARSAIADVYSQQGYFDLAIEAYADIPDWDKRAAVITGIADNLRRKGLLQDALDLYSELVESESRGKWFLDGSATRAYMGMAQVARYQGRFQDAQTIYQKVLQRYDLSEADSVFARIALSNTLKQIGKYPEAFEVIDAVIKQYPFATEAKYIRGSILGLISEELQGLSDLPDTGANTWRQWLGRYYRGLLLLKLGQYEEARRKLVDELPRALANAEEKPILRLGAALCFLYGNEYSKADEQLSKLGSSTADIQMRYLLLVLSLHSAAQQNRDEQIQILSQTIEKELPADSTLREAVVLIFKRDFKAALRSETDAMLKLAA